MSSVSNKEEERVGYFWPWMRLIKTFKVIFTACYVISTNLTIIGSSFESVEW